MTGHIVPFVSGGCSLDYLKRVVDVELDELLDGLGAVAIEGPIGTRSHKFKKSK
jgi:hypothetical protein